MLPMKLNMSKVKKVAGDKHSSTFRHEDGHEIKVVHKALAPLQRKQLERMPLHLADGGDTAQTLDIDSLKQAAASDPSTPNLNLPPLAGPNNMNLSPGTDIKILPPHPDSEAPEKPTSNAPDAPQAAPQQGQPSEMSQVASNNNSNVVGAYNQGQQGIGEQAKVQAQQSQADQKVMQEDLNARTQLAAGMQANLKDFQAHQQQFMNDYANGQIDPNHYMESRSTGQKVGNAIGLFLGGLGQGLIGGNNPAQDWINNQINRDIDAQKANLGKKKTLLEANQELFHDNILANNATRVNMNDIYDHKIQNEAAKLGTAQAKAAADMAHSKFALENAGLLQQSAMRATALHAAQVGGGGLADPSMLVPALVPNEHQKQVFGEIEAAQDTKRMGSTIMKAFETADKENTIMKTGGGMLRTPASVYALHQAMQPTFKDLEGTVRQAAMDNTFKNITPMPGDSEHTINEKREALQQYLQSKASAPTAKAYGIDLSQYNSTAPIQARPETKTVNGVTYMRGPNGQAVRVK